MKILDCDGTYIHAILVEVTYKLVLVLILCRYTVCHTRILSYSHTITLLSTSISLIFHIKDSAYICYPVLGCLSFHRYIPFTGTSR